MKELTIGIPLYNNMPIQSFLSILRLLKNLKEPYEVIYTYNYPVEIARNTIVERFLKRDSDHLIFIDSDNIFPDDMFAKLFNMILLKADIATGISFKKAYPFYPTIYQRHGEIFKPITDYQRDSIIDIDACGMACCMIKREVFEKMEFPWYEVVIHDFTEDEGIMGEDLCFCKKAKQMGFNIMADTGLVIPHIGGVIDERTYFAVRNVFYTLKEMRQGDKKWFGELSGEEIKRMVDIKEQMI